MNEQQFNELLKKLKIPTNNRSYADIFDLLDAKLSEYLDRQDAASQELVDDIQDALDYAELKKNEVGSGIALKREEVSKEEEKADISELRDASEKARKEKEQVESTNGQASAPQQPAPQQPQSQSVAGQQAGKLWFSSLSGADNINTMFFQALDDLKYGEFDHAKSIFEAILQVEPNNASAYLGKLMAIHKLKELRAIGNSYDKDLFSDINMRRAYDHGTDQQKKYLDDAKAEVANGKKYKDADRKAKDVNDENAQMEAAQMFMALGSYRDAAQRKAQCVERVKELKYNRAIALNKKAYTAADYRAAVALYKEVSGYKNADNLAAECEAIAKRKDGEEAERKRKDDLKASFLKLKNDFEAEERSQRDRCKDGIRTAAVLNTTPSTEELSKRLEAMKTFATEHPEVNDLAAAQTHITTAEGVVTEIGKLVKEYETAVSMKKNEGKWDFLLIAAMLVVLFVAGMPSRGEYVSGLATFFPIRAQEDTLAVLDAESPYIFSNSELTNLELIRSEDVKTVSLPKAELESVYLRAGNYSELEWQDTVKSMGLSEVYGANIPESVETLRLNGLISGVQIPSTVKRLEMDNCEAYELELPEGLESIQMEDVVCPENLTIPSTVRELNMLGANMYVLNVKEGLTTAEFRACGNLYQLNLPTSMRTFVLSESDYMEEITIPEGVISCTISGCDFLNKINMPSTLQEIALEGTMSFEGIAFPENVQHIYIRNNEFIKDVVYSETAQVTISGCANLEDR